MASLQTGLSMSTPILTVTWYNLSLGIVIFVVQQIFPRSLAGNQPVLLPTSNRDRQTDKQSKRQLHSQRNVGVTLDRMFSCLLTLGHTLSDLVNHVYITDLSLVCSAARAIACVLLCVLSQLCC